MQVQFDATDPMAGAGPPLPRTTSVVSIASSDGHHRSSSERSAVPTGTSDTLQMPSVHPLYLRRKIMRNVNAPWY